MFLQTFEFEELYVGYPIINMFLKTFEFEELYVGYTIKGKNHQQTILRLLQKFLTPMYSSF